MSKNSDTTKLVFFSEAIIYEMIYAIQNVSHLLDAGEITHKQAEKLLNNAAMDLHDLFWAITSKISQVKDFSRACVTVDDMAEFRVKLNKVSKEYFADKPGDDLA